VLPLDGAVQARIVKARTQLLMDQPFFGMLGIKLALREDTTCKGMWADGQTLGYNPVYVAQLMEVELLGLLAHLVLHIVAGHPWRRAGRELVRWNKACDYAINPIQQAARFHLAEGALLDEAYVGLPAELIYLKLEPEPAQDSDSAPGSESSEPSTASTEEFLENKATHFLGEVRDAPEDLPELEAEWQMAKDAAARFQGQLPGSLERLVQRSLEPRVDWKEALREFVQQSIASADYSWAAPNRRWLAQGLYLPSLRSNAVSCLVIVRDTSGSIADTYLDMFNAEILDILNTIQPEESYVVDCDAGIQQVITLDKYDIPDALPAKGGGGTSFVPVFNWLEEMGIAPACVVYLSDLEGTFPAVTPDVPVIWAVPEGYRKQIPPFGEVLSLTLD
jgi:predicted metal-dependent peptidase